MNETTTAPRYVQQRAGYLYVEDQPIPMYRVIDTVTGEDMIGRVNCIEAHNETEALNREPAS